MAAKKNFPPAADHALLAAATQTAAVVAPEAVAYGSTTGDLTAFSTLIGEFGSGLAALEAAQDVARSLRAAKDAKAAQLDAAYRAIYRRARAKGVSNTMLVAANMPAVDDSRTPVPPPSMIPALLLVKTEGATHELRVIDKDNPTRRAKPDDVENFLFFKHVGETAPATIEGCVFAVNSSRMGATIANAPADAGKTVWYLCAAANGKGEMGPVSEPLRATIAA
jgi:hypothetical protein